MERVGRSNHSLNNQSVPLLLLPTSSSSSSPHPPRHPGPSPTLTQSRPSPSIPSRDLGPVISSSIYNVDDRTGTGSGGVDEPYVFVPSIISPVEETGPYIDTQSHQVLPTGINSYYPSEADFWGEWAAAAAGANGTSPFHRSNLTLAGVGGSRGGGGAGMGGGAGGGGLGDEDPFNWGILLLAPLVVFGIAGNTLVILAISLERRLQNVTNYFLLSLAVTDLLVSLIVMPFSIINEFTGRWLFGLILCNLFVTADVLMCTSSILHLCTISLERYIGIRYPLWAKNKSNKRTVLVKIVLVWTLALAITSPITVLGIVSQQNIFQRGQCYLANQHFIIYGSIFAFFIPLSIMVLMYALTVRMLNRQAKLCGAGAGADGQGGGPGGGGGRGGGGGGAGGGRGGEGQPMIRRSTSRRHWQRQNRHTVLGTRMSSSYRHDQLTATNSYPLGAGGGARFTQRYQPLTKRNTLPLSKRSSNNAGNKPSSLYHPHGGGGGCGGDKLSAPRESAEFEYCNGSHHGEGIGSDERLEVSTPASGSANSSPASKKSWRRLTSRKDSQTSPNGNGGGGDGGCNGGGTGGEGEGGVDVGEEEPKRLKELVRKHHVAVKAANILLMRKDLIRKENSAVQTEQKASKVLGVVFMIFVICWAPFFLVNILQVLCSRCSFSPTLFTVFVWLGYVSSTLNPIIYTIFNKVFKLTFLKLLCCRYGLLHRGRRRSQHHSHHHHHVLHNLSRAGNSSNASSTTNTTTISVNHNNIAASAVTANNTTATINNNNHHHHHNHSGTRGGGGGGGGGGGDVGGSTVSGTLSSAGYITCNSLCRSVAGGGGGGKGMEESMC